MQKVRINKYPKNHVNAYARVDFKKDGFIYVTNMNMPFQGTIACGKFTKKELTFIK